MARDRGVVHFSIPSKWNYLATGTSWLTDQPDSQLTWWLFHDMTMRSPLPLMDKILVRLSTSIFVGITPTPCMPSVPLWTSINNLSQLPRIIFQYPFNLG